MKQLFSLLLLIISLNAGYGQALSSYNFHAFSCSYDSLTTPFIGYSGLTPGGGGPYDDCYYNSIPIGFNFTYCGNTYTSVSASANCWIALGQTLPFSSTLIVNTYDCDLSGTSTSGLAFPYNLPRPIIAALWIDVVTAGPNLRYATLGTAPNRKFVIEWTNCGFYNLTGIFPPHVCVEIILHETSNTIDFAYKFIAPGASNTKLEAIGITDGSGPYPVTGTQSFWSLSDAGPSPTASMTVETRNISTLPATDQVYRWSYQCIGKPDAGNVTASIVNACTTYNARLSLDCSSSKSAGIGYQWQSSPDSVTWGNVSGAIVDTYLATVTSNIYYRCILTCSNTGLTDTTAGVKLKLNTPPGTITGPTILCSTTTITLSNTTTGGSWSSSSTPLATVGSGSGIVTGVSAGTAAITYKLPTGCYATYTVTVNAMPAAITGVKTVCKGSATTLTNTLAGGTWSSSNTAVAPVGSTTGIVTGLSTGTATITYSKGSGLVCYAVTTVTVNPTPSPITGSPTVCVGATSALSSLTPGGTWTSTNTTVANVDPATGVMTGVTAGMATISYSFSTGCAASLSVSVYALPSPIAGVPFVCVGRTTTLISSAGGKWTSSNTAIAQAGSSTGIVSGITTGTATITYSLATGCYRTILMTVNPNPPAITGMIPLCVGATNTLSSAMTGGSWTSSDGTKATINVSTGLETAVAAGNPTITYTISTGCYATATATINPPPPAITGVMNVCEGATSTLSNSVGGGTWASSNTAVAKVGSGTGIVSGILAGTATITYTLGTGCFTTTAITVNPAPAAITGPTAVCAGASISLTSATSGGTWSSSNSTVAMVSGGTVVGLINGTSVITYTVPGTGCVATSTITVSSAPGAISGVKSVCVAATTMLSNTIGGGTWISGNTTIATAGFTTGIITGVSAGTASITYSLGGTCKSTTTVTVYPLPGAITGTATMCPGGTTALSAGTGGNWSSGSTTIATVTSTGVVTGISAGTSIITYKIFSTGCMSTMVVTVNPLPPAITGITSVCIGGTNALSNSVTGGTWASSNTTIATIGFSTGVVSGVAIGTTTITYTAPGTGCAITTTVTVMPPPPAITGTASVCPGGTTTLSNPITGGNWSSSSTANATIGSSTGIVTGIVAGTTMITYIPAAGCAVTRSVTVDPLPSPIAGASAVCVASAITLTNTGGGTWSSSTTTVATIGLSTGIVTGITLGTTTITYTLATGCSITTVVTVSPGPTAIGGTKNICAGATTTLTNMITGGSWTSSNTAVATAGFTSGIITGVTAGTATITYSLGTACNVTTTITVTAAPGPITGTTAICTGATTTLSNSTTGGTWTSDNTAVATIGLTTGLVTAVATGTATITYDNVCITTTTITVNLTPAVIAGAATLCKGATTTLSDAVTGGAWASSNTAVATVGVTSGTITGTGGGTCTITYTLGSGCFVTKGVTVNPVAPITGATAVCISASATMSNAVTGGTWSTISTAITIGASSGVVTGLSLGSGIAVDYTTPAGCTTSTTISVSPTPTAITGSSSLCTGQSTTLSNSVTGGTWASSNTGVAMVGVSSGIVNALAAGTATITYSLGSGCSVTISVTVNPFSPVISGVGAVCTGATITLTNAIGGGIWSSSNTLVATTGFSAGTVTGASTGSVTITYTLPTGCATTKAITVNLAPAPITGGGKLCEGQTLTLFTSTPGVTWSGTPTTVATIGVTTGIVTTVGPGVFTPVATLGTCSATTTLTITPSPTAITGPASVCAGQTITLSNGVPGGIWTSNNKTIAVVDSRTGDVTGVSSGTVLIYYTIGSGCTAFATVIVHPTSPITGSNTVCAGQRITLSDTTLGGIWTSNNTLIATVGSSSGIVTGGTGGGVVTIFYTMRGGCTASYAVTVSIPPPSITGIKQTCAGSTTSLGNPVTGGTWNSSNTVIATVHPTTGLVTGINPGTAMISYTTSLCPATTIVTVYPVPAAIKGPGDVCTGSAITLVNTGGGIWSSSNTSVASIGTTSGILIGSVPGTTTVAYTLPTGCLASKIITVNPLPAAITGSTNVCEGSTTSLSDATPGGAWSSLNMTIVTIDAGTGVATGVTAGTAVIRYTIATGCVTTTTLAVLPIPAAIAGIAEVCVGDITPLINPSSGGVWSSGNTAVATVGVGSGVVAGVTAGTVIISYTFSTGCATTVIVTVNPLPSPITGSTQVCIGYTIPLSDATPGGAWGSGSTGIATISGAGVVTGVSPGTSVISYRLGTGCSVTTIVTVTPLPKPIGGSVYVCAGAPTTFTNAVPGGTWSSSNPSVAIAGLTTGIVTPLTLGATDIVYTMSAGCYASVSISVVPLPNVYTVTGGGTFCSADTGVHIGLSGSNTGTNYFLYLGSKMASGPLSGTGSALDFGLQTVGGIYTVMATNTITGCSNVMSGSVTVTVIPSVKPVINILTSPNDTVCSGTKTTFTSVISGGGSAPLYRWDVNGTVVTSTTSYSFVPADGDVVTCRLTSNAVCATPTVVSNSVKMKVLVPQTPSATLTTYPGDTICEGNQVTLTPAPVFGGSAPVYTWVVNGSTVGTGSTFTYTPNDKDIVYCRMTSNYLCLVKTTVPSNSVELVVDSPLLPHVTIVANPGVRIGIGQTDTLTAVATNVGSTPAYQWFINGLPVPGATTNTYISNEFRYPQEDSVSCVVTSSGLCNLTTFNWIYINVRDIVGVQHVPTGSNLAVSPNPNKGEFTIKGTTGTGDETLTLELTNLLGQVIYRSTIEPHNGAVNEHIKLRNTLANGMYILTVRSGSVREVFHVVVEQ